METSAAAVVAGATMHLPLFIHSCYSYATLHFTFYYMFQWGCVTLWVRVHSREKEKGECKKKKKKNDASRKAGALTAEVCRHCVVRLSNFKYAPFRSDFDAATVRQTAGRRWLGLIRSLLAALSTRWRQTWTSWCAQCEGEGASKHVSTWIKLVLASGWLIIQLLAQPPIFLLFLFELKQIFSKQTFLIR